MRRSRSTRLVALAGAVTVLALGVGAMTASAARIGGFAVRPAQSNPRERAGRAYFIIMAKAGSTRREAVVVTNNGSKPLVLYVDPVDGLTGATSGAVYGNRGVAVHSAGAWVTPDARSVTVPPGRAIDVPFTVRIPGSAVPGDHLAGLALQVARASKSSGRFSVRVVVRAVVGIEVQVPGFAVPRIRISSLALAPLPGTTVPSAVVTLADVGGRLCRPRLTVAIKGQNVTRQATQKLGTILPGDRIAYPFKWPGALADGSYAVTATATECGPQVVKHAIATFSRRSGQAGQPSTALGATAPLSNGGHDRAWWLYGLISLAALLAGGLVLLVGRHGDGRSGDGGPIRS